ASLPAGTVHDVQLFYDFTSSSGVHFVDWLQSFDASESITAAQVCPGTSGHNCGTTRVDTTLPTSQGAGVTAPAGAVSGFNIAAGATLPVAGQNFTNGSGTQRFVTLHFTVGGTVGSGNKD